MENLDFPEILFSFFDLCLEVTHAHVLCVDLFSLSLNLGELIRFSLEVVTNILGVPSEPVSVVLSKLSSFVENHGVFIILSRFFLTSNLALGDVLIELHFQLLGLFASLLGVVDSFFDLVFVVIFSVVQLGGLIGYSIDLGVQDELLPDNVKFHFTHLLLLLVIIFSHLHVLCLEQVDMLMR